MYLHQIAYWHVTRNVAAVYGRAKHGNLTQVTHPSFSR